MDKHIQAKAISTEDAIQALISGPRVNLRTLEQAFPDYPAKVVHAKYRALFRNGLLDDGCDCGCSTHATLTNKATCQPPRLAGAHAAGQHTPASVRSTSE